MSRKFVIAIRTHFWDATVDQVVRRIEAATTAQVVVAADETNGTVAVPDKYVKLAHSNATFETMGLPLVPTPQRALWFNGDYPLYHLIAELEFDYLMMIESDCGMTGSLDGLLETLAEDGVDIATKNNGPRDQDYPWFDVSLKWFGPRFGVTSVQGGIFPVVFASRRAVEELRSARLAMAAANGGDPSAWPHCETFAASQLHFSDYRCVALDAYADVSDVTVDLPIHVDEIGAAVAPPGKVIFFHPVLSGAKYDQRWRTYYRKQSKSLRRLAKDNKQLLQENRKLATALLDKEKLAEARYRKIGKLLKGISDQEPPSLWKVIKQRLS